jgi:peptide/nickel transport system permease protein
LKNVLRGDLGNSLYSQTKVAEELFARFPATIELAVAAIIFASIFGVVAGVISAVKKNSIFDYIGMSAALIGVSIPIFWLGIMFIILFSVILGWLPVTGRLDILTVPSEITGFYLLDALLSGNMNMFKDALRHLILPTVTLGMYSTAVIARMTRSSVLETLEQDYVRTARAKGLKETAVIIVHALRNAALPIVTVIGLQLGSLLGGAVLTETVFAWPGIGKYAVDAITRSDYPVVQGAVLLVAFIFVIVNLFVDVIYAALDPRIKYS